METVDGIAQPNGETDFYDLLFAEMRPETGVKLVPNGFVTG